MKNNDDNDYRRGATNGVADVLLYTGLVTAIFGAGFCVILAIYYWG